MLPVSAVESSAKKSLLWLNNRTLPLSQKKANGRHVFTPITQFRDSGHQRRILSRHGDFGFRCRGILRAVLVLRLTQ